MRSSHTQALKIIRRTPMIAPTTTAHLHRPSTVQLHIWTLTALTDNSTLIKMVLLQTSKKMCTNSKNKYINQKNMCQIKNTKTIWSSLTASQPCRTTAATEVRQPRQTFTPPTRSLRTTNPTSWPLTTPWTILILCQKMINSWRSKTKWSSIRNRSWTRPDSPSLILRPT